MNLDPYLILHTKVDSKRIKPVNLRPKTIQLLEVNRERKRHDIGFGSDFLYMTPKAQATKANIDKLDSKTMTNFCAPKATTKQSDLRAGRKYLQIISIG